MIDTNVLGEIVVKAPAGPRLMFGQSREALYVLSRHANRTVCIGSFDGTFDPLDTLAGIVQSPPDEQFLRRLYAKNPNVQISKGYLPEVFSKVPAIIWSFVLIDMHHYAPTLDAAMWVWPRIKPDGILCCSGWDEKSNLFAASAIKEMTNIKKKPPEYNGRLAYWKM